MIHSPHERSAQGERLQAKLLAKEADNPQTVYQSSFPDYIFAEVWSRPNLDYKSRYLIAIASAANNGGESDILDGYVRGALVNQELSVSQLREAALHTAIYCGWGTGHAIDNTTSRILDQLGWQDEPLESIPKEFIDQQQRLQNGQTEFEHVMTFAGPPPVCPYFEAGIFNFVFGEVWNRPGLSQRDRRWLTLVGVCDSTAENPILTHVYGAMASGNCSVTEMQEFILQYAIHSGWPRASYAQVVLFDMAKKIQNGQNWDGQPKD